MENTTNTKKTNARTRCWYCGKAIEFKDGFGWREAGTAQGYTCHHERHGRAVAGEGHEPEEATR